MPPQQTPGNSVQPGGQPQQSGTPPPTPNGALPQQPASQPPPPQQPTQPPPPPQPQTPTPAPVPPVSGPSGQQPASQPPAAPQQPTQPPPPPQPRPPVPAQGAPGQQAVQPQQFNAGQQNFQYPATPKPNKLKKALLVGGGGLIAILSLVFGVMFALGFVGGISYDELTRTATTSDTEENISIRHPVEMKEVYIGSTGMELTHSDEESGGMYSQVYIDSIFLGQGLGDVRDELTGNLTDNESELYQEIVRDFSNQPDERRNFEIGDFREVDIDNIEGILASSVSFDIPLATDEDEYVPVSGEIMYVFGEEKLFIVVVTALDEVYRGNQSIFNEMIDSLRFES